MEEQKKYQNKYLTTEQTEAFLDFYEARVDEFHSRKKKFAYERIAEDMLSAGVIDSQINANHLRNKMESLLRAYKIAINIDNKRNRTGTPPCVAPFMERMHNLFGKKLKSIEQNVNFGADSIGANSGSSRTSFEQVLLSNDSDIDIEKLGCFSPTPPSETEIPLHTVNTSTSTSGNSKGKMSRSMYFAKKLEYMKKESEQKNKRWLEYMKIQKEKQEMRRMQLQLLKEYLKKLNN